jgi:hypothetical protein
MGSWKDSFKTFPPSAEQLKKKMKGKLVGKIDRIEDMPPKEGEEEKPCLILKDFDYPIRLNKTNCIALSERWGDEMEDWVGHTCEVTVGKGQFQGDVCDTIIVKPLK